MGVADVLFTDYRRRVLGLLLLHPDTHFHVREISRLTGTIAGTLSRELGKLSDAGVLNKRRVGNQVQYSANRDSPVFEDLANLLRKTSGLVDVLADALLPFADRIAFAFVFGSVASGREQARSDIDLMVVGDVDFSAIVTALHPSEGVLRREINAKVCSMADWHALVAQGGSFVRDVLSKKKLFVLGGENELGSPRGADDRKDRA